MATLRFLLKRFFAQRLLGLAVVVTLGFTIGVLVAGPIYADAAREAILSSAVATAPVTVKNVRFVTYGAPAYDYGAADATIRDSVTELPVARVVPQGRGTVRLLAAEATSPVSLTVMFRDGAPDHLSSKGEPPTGPREIALQGSVARLLGVGIGDTLIAIGPTDEQAELTLVGLFDPPERTDAFWYGDQTPFPPPDSTELSPGLMDRRGYLEVMPALGVTSEYVWDTFLDLVTVPFERARGVPAVIERISADFRAAPESSQLQVTSGLETLITLVRQRVQDLHMPIYLVVFQIGAVTLAILAGVGSLVLTRQSFELAVLRSRGFSSGKLLAAQGVQAVFTTIAAYPLGLLLGMALATLASHANGPSLPGVLFPIRLSPFALVLGAVGAVVGAVTLLLLSLPHVRRTILEERRLLSREDRPLISRVPVELFVLPVAAFMFVELRGAAETSTSAGDQLDPLVLLTPTLLIFSLSFLALRVLLWSLRRLDRPVARTKSLPIYLATRRLGRSPGTSFATSLLLLLAVGLLIASTSYRAIALRSHEDSARQQVGADWNVQITAPSDPIVATKSVPPNAVAVIRSQLLFEGPGSFPLPPSVIGVDPDRFATGGWWRADYSTTPLETWLRELEVPDPGIGVTSETFSATVTAETPAEGLQIQVTYVTDDDRVRTISAGALEEGTTTYHAILEGAGRISSITFFEEGIGDAPDTVELELRDVVAGDPVDLASWAPLRWRGSEGTVRPAGGGISLTIDTGAGHVVGGIAPPMQPLPALVSAEISRSQGSSFVATVGGQQLDFRQVALAEAFPSVIHDFVVVSTPGLLRASVRIPEPGLGLNEVWAMGDEDPRPALERAGLVPGPSQATAPIIAARAQLPQSLAVGMNFAAAVGGLGLVVLGVAVGLYFAQRRREFEFASLRAMGTEPMQVTQALLLEQGLMVVFAIIAGLAIGFAILRVLMPYIRQSIGSAFPSAILVVDWPALAISLCAIVAASAVGLLAALRALLRSSVTSVLRGEAE